jgi:hypothetical protein
VLSVVLVWHCLSQPRHIASQISARTTSSAKTGARAPHRFTPLCSNWSTVALSLDLLVVSHRDKSPTSCVPPRHTRWDQRCSRHTASCANSTATHRRLAAVRHRCDRNQRFHNLCAETAHGGSATRAPLTCDQFGHNLLHRQPPTAKYMVRLAHNLRVACSLTRPSDVRCGRHT